jgi:hypothetical protein
MENNRLLTAIENRHSVRQFKDQPLSPSALGSLNSLIQNINYQSGLNIQLITDEPLAFSTLLAKYGRFKNVKNYLAIVGKDDQDLFVNAGYYGERLVLEAQALGLNTCWVALSFSRNKCPAVIEDGQKLAIVIALGYGQTQGVKHKQKPFSNFVQTEEQTLPEWFKKGVESAMLCPTAINQQKFYFVLDGNTVMLKTRFGPCSKIDLGIAKLHFELGAGIENFVWKKDSK